MGEYLRNDRGIHGLARQTAYTMRNSLTPVASLLALCMLMSSAPCRAQQAPTDPGFGDYHPAPVYTERVSRSFYLPMRDGVRLAMRVSAPAQNGKAVEGRFPVIWQAGLSTSEQAGPTGAAYWTVPSLTQYGYVVVQIARRGNGQSFGVRRGYNDRTESDDAYEVTEWLARQPWSTGAIGVYGCSNTGDAAMHVMTSRPPHLKAVFAGCFSWNKYDAMRRGGIFAQWGTGPQRTIEQDMSADAVDADDSKSLLRQAAEEHQRSTNLYELWRSMPYRDSWSPLVGSRFWSESSVSSYADAMLNSGVALYIQAGWHDEFRDQGLIAALNLPDSRILIGPWAHCLNPGFDLLREMQRFFDIHLKGIDTGLSREPRIHYFTINAPAARQWRAAERWPVPGMSLHKYYLTGRHELRAAPPASSARAEFTVHTDITCPDANAGPWAQPCHVPGQGISFSGAPLTRDLEVTGNALVGIRLAVDRLDANIFAYLEDLAPDGTVTLVTEGRLKASLRQPDQAPFQLPGTPWHRAFEQDVRPLVPGTAVDLEFDLLPTSYLYLAGHRLQLTVTGADYRERNRDADADGARIALLIEPAWPAYVELPTMIAAASR
jgi:putative CocE/NonD family hydrolase